MTAVATVNTKRGAATPRAFPGVVATARQELNTAAARDKVRKALPDHDHYVPSPTWAKRLMISWPTTAATVVPTSQWAHLIPADIKPTAVDEHGVCWKAHGGLEKISPARGTIGAMLQVADIDLGVLVLDSHFVSGAWSRKLRARRPWRRRKWRKHYAMLRQITEALDAAGFLVVHAGDVNRREVLDLPGLRHANGNPAPGYDQIHASTDLDPRRFRRAAGDDKLGSDHYPREATIGDPPTMPELTINQRFYRTLKADPAVPAVLRRDEWGSKPDGRPWRLAPDVDDVYQWRRHHKPHHRIPEQRSDTLVQHVTVTDDTGGGVRDFKSDMQLLERIGLARFGSGVSYNIVVDQDGMVGIGMPLDAKGTHTVNVKQQPGFSYDQNYVAIGIAWIAQPGDRLTPECRASIAACIRALREVGALTDGFDYKPHSFFAAKACPLQVMRDAMPAIRKAGMGEAPDLEPELPPTRVSNGRLLAEQGATLIDQAPEERPGAHALADALLAVLEDDTYPER